MVWVQDLKLRDKKNPAGSLSGVVLCRFFRGVVCLGIGKKLLLARVLDSMCSDLVHGDGCLVMMFAW